MTDPALQILQVMLGRVSPPLAWAVLHADGKDPIAEAWAASRDGLSMWALFEFFGPDDEDAVAAVHDKLHDAMVMMSSRFLQCPRCTSFADSRMDQRQREEVAPLMRAVVPEPPLTLAQVMEEAKR